jgi:hypothetical protein
VYKILSPIGNGRRDRKAWLWHFLAKGRMDEVKKIISPIIP